MGAYMSSQIAEMLASSKGERVHREVEQALKQVLPLPVSVLISDFLMAGKVKADPTM